MFVLVTIYRSLYGSSLTLQIEKLFQSRSWLWRPEARCAMSYSRRALLTCSKFVDFLHGREWEAKYFRVWNEAKCHPGAFWASITNWFHVFFIFRQLFRSNASEKQCEFSLKNVKSFWFITLKKKPGLIWNANTFWYQLVCVNNSARELGDNDVALEKQNL